MSYRRKINTDAITRNLNDFDKETGNIYETVAILSQRANQIAVQNKKDLVERINQYDHSTEVSDEIFENKEQIEIVKFFEMQPKPATRAIEEFLRGDIYYRLPEPAKK
ncbi:MAG: DNA-directed RNA polymerase subunit omega [Bacteroidales bacterium]|jgi:DNA-directed RNA polymerase subunit K/omega|nr:DNA-directed RNA polymerase subunit omega [Bacteroidales bacterium]